MHYSQLKKTSHWQSLENKAARLRQQGLQSLFSKDPTRVAQFSLQVGEIDLDYSKNYLTQDIKADLLALAEVCHLKEAIQALFKGEIVNVTEKRPALHTALRNITSSEGAVYEAIEAQKEKMYHFVNLLQTGKWLGATSLPITDVVNLGIGGSDLGPVMAVEALKSYAQSTVKLHFVSNVDPFVIHSQLAHLNPATTLFIISSKSFSTPETLTNARVAKQWLQEKLGTQPLENHFIAVTANPEKAIDFGISEQAILNFWDWVGGRFSIWSTIGFPLALSIGVQHFEAFLSGANLMDTHFAHADFSENMPVLMALIGIWYINFWHAQTLAVLPYSENLRRFPDYLQQLDMESNGKSVQHSGHAVDYATGPIVWGQAGTNGQHAFYQLLHQGTHFIPVDFIVPLESNTPATAQHRQLVANCFAQAQALMQGSQSDNVLNKHEDMPGNKPSNMLLLSKLTPSALGQLLALYEHKVFVQGVIWQINSFDQPGVELGKKLANNVMKCFESGIIGAGVDPSTHALILKMQSLA